ncbi:SMP-30/gluconolactonase/LRE family protein [Acuticoccus sp. I52.16.1]|uniref:SMP-30/gluconolactonase/LRE family protein n=1 Tax=Acuticoccus sp. I52.16.1 TaxID=2928472 RepID=UPI001FD3F214|nr:SMP-30/gluconolactonase/LRE family protein [Acuticoccus sp. I52.16.1]UOM36567.1 SMP-30/gluconolactonase/LRE family protein [Acuticoccus sp. I52.16.1]
MATLFREIASGLRFPEGPVWCADGTLLVVELEAGALTRIGLDGSAERVAILGGSPNGAAIGPDGACYVCNSGGFAWHEDAEGLRMTGQGTAYSGGRIERVDLATGAVTRLYDRTEHGELRGPNDLVFDRHGGFWFTDSGKTRPRDMDRGGVYYAHPDGSSIRQVIFPLMTPNGVGLSREEDKLYVAETPTGRLWEFDVVAPGEVAPLPWPSPNGGRLLAGLPDYQLLDSLAVDSEGSVCVATLMNGGITVVSRDGVRHLPLPDRYTTNLCWGGPDLRTAYVTFGQSGRLVALDWHCAGLALNFSR